MNDSNRGHIVLDQNLLDEKYICSVCSCLLRDPVQLDCGDRICQMCVEAKDNFVRCGKCGSETRISEVKLDKGFSKDMQTLIVKCFSCDWSGQLKNYQGHLEQTHRQYKCPHCGEIFDSLSLMEVHVERLCTKIVVDCLLHKYGCKEKIRHSDLQRHCLTEEHQRAVIFCLNELNSQLIERYQTSGTNTASHMEVETSDFPNKMTTTSLTTVATEKYTDEIKHIFEMIDLLSNGKQMLNEEVKRIDSESVQLSQSVETMETNLPTIKLSIEESSNTLSGTITNLTILQQEVSSLKQIYEDKQVTSYDGTLIWRITEFQKKMNEAKSERQVSIYSPPFCSSPTGYKMRARLYLYGDGNARRTHMSLFFVILRGPHDSILTFPFSYKVTFCLFDQTPEKNHIIDSFRPDIKSNSFQRPRSDMNIASGIPKFVQLSTIEKPDNQYVVNDTMFIKVMVDFENIQKPMLSYVFNLNPGLPTHAHQWMIRQETERRAQQSQLTVQGTLTSNNSKKK